ncbi:MAG TPA: tyrosine-type recombinase/integrase [Anaeromyxobacteraceae bacterium]|nr:tyrosine-type recombinase/integrase [Anaeromyxobacteraceae bacterium]
MPISEPVRNTERIWRRHRATHGQAVEIGERIRNRLELERPVKRKTVLTRLSQEEAARFARFAERVRGKRALLVKTLLHSGAQIAEFVTLRVDDFSLEEAKLHIRKGKNRKARDVSILPELARELRAHFADRRGGNLFECRFARSYTPRRVQQIVKEIAIGAGIAKRVYPHLLRYAVAPRLVEGGLPLDQVQEYLGYRGDAITT